jgi:hypothetical protein
MLVSAALANEALTWGALPEWGVALSTGLLAFATFRLARHARAEVGEIRKEVKLQSEQIEATRRPCVYPITDQLFGVTRARSPARPSKACMPPHPHPGLREGTPSRYGTVERNGRVRKKIECPLGLLQPCERPQLPRKGGDDLFHPFERPVSQWAGRNRHRPLGVFIHVRRRGKQLHAHSRRP